MFYKVYLKIRAFFNYIGRLLFLSSFASHGHNVRFFPWRSEIYYSNIEVGNNVYLGPGAMLMAAVKKIIIGNKVLFGPGVSIITGDHNYNKVGTFILDNRVKKPEDDLEVIIEDDVWIGANATVLKGVTVGRGSIVAAGSLVINDVLPYSIYGGVPAKKLKNRFDFEDALKHEKELYNSENQFSEEQLSHLK